MSNSKLVEIAPSNWPQLRDLYRRDWPDNLVGFYTVDTFLRWRKQKGTIDHLVIYSLDGDWEKDGTYVCIHKSQLFANTLDACLDRLQQTLGLLDWSGGYAVSTLYDRFRPAVQAIIDAHQLTIDFDGLTLFYYISHEKAIQLDVTCPPGITLKSLNKDHAMTINGAWPHNHPGSQFFIQQIIELSPNIGAFDENDQLVAWCLRWQAGPHGAMQVLDTHKRRGLGLLMCKAMSKRLAEMELDSCACVLLDNEPSKKTFERAGFRVIDKVHWLNNKPSIPTIDSMG